MVVTPPTNRYAFCWFRNFYRIESTGYARDCTGIVLQLRDAIYMLGLLGPRDGLKLIVLPSVNSNAQILSGLVASSSSDSDPLMVRIVLERTNATEMKRLPVSQRPNAIAYPQSRRLVGDSELKWRLRNHIAFEVGTEIGKSKTGSGISAAAMKAVVSRLCEGQFFLDGLAFNPADHIHYPFNQALMSYDPSERRGGSFATRDAANKVTRRRSKI